MPLYYMHIKDHDGGVTADPEGSDLPDLDAARQEVVLAARQIMSWGVLEGKPPDGNAFVITDEGGSVLLEFPFKDALDKT